MAYSSGGRFGNWGDEISVNGGVLAEGAVTTEEGGGGGLIAVLHIPQRKCRPSPPAVARNLEYLVGVPSKAATSGMEKKIRAP